MDIRYRGPTPDWSSFGPVELVESTDGHARLRVDRTTDLAAIINVARQTTEVVSFAYQPPTLSELFREAVSA
jgi:ABC-2 type transport system ATP-binding protein